LLLISWKCEE